MDLVRYLAFINLILALIWVYVLQRRYDGYSLTRNTVSDLVKGSNTKAGFAGFFVVFSVLQLIYGLYVTRFLDQPYRLSAQIFLIIGSFALSISALIPHKKWQWHKYFVVFSILAVSSGVSLISAALYSNQSSALTTLLCLTILLPVLSIYLKSRLNKVWWELPIIAMVVSWNILSFLLIN